MYNKVSGHISIERILSIFIAHTPSQDVTMHLNISMASLITNMSAICGPAPLVIDVLDASTSNSSLEDGVDVKLITSLVHNLKIKPYGELLSLTGVTKA
jgi:hypothetical protein